MKKFHEYSVLGKAIYTSKGNQNGEYIKIFLQGHKTILIFFDENIAYFGEDFGEIKEFNGFPQKVIYNGKEMRMTNHDFQIEKRAEGKTEGECEYWDYEGDDKTIFVSVAVLADGTRSDVELHEINFDDVKDLV